MNLSEFFHNEVKPAFGCTEPGAVAYAAASAAKYLGSEVERIHLELSGNVYKNGVNVGVPGTDGGIGNPLAAVLGVIAGDPEKGLQSLEGVSPADVGRAKSLEKSGLVSQKVVFGVPSVYVKVTLEAGDETVTSVISGKHDNLVEITKGDNVLFNKTDSKESGYGYSCEELALQDMNRLWNLAESISDETANYLLEGSEMNLRIAAEGLSKPWGLGVGYHINQIEPDDLLYNVKSYAGAAADVRMGGGPWPVMSSAGSGNHGITAIIPPTLYANANGNSKRELAEALALSHLVTHFIKVYTGILSPICGCAIAAGAGAASAVVKLAHGTPKQADIAVASLIASVMGMNCDGGKGSCALKVSTAAGEAYLYALLALRGGGVDRVQGLLKPDLGHVARVLGEISEDGLSKMDEVVLQILQRG